jgi:hypothetical protein
MESGNTTSIDYVENNNEENNAIEFADDTYENLSDFEDLTVNPTEPLDAKDYETL